MTLECPEGIGCNIQDKLFNVRKEYVILSEKLINVNSENLHLRAEDNNLKVKIKKLESEIESYQNDAIHGEEEI